MASENLLNFAKDWYRDDIQGFFDDPDESFSDWSEEEFLNWYERMIYAGNELNTPFWDVAEEVATEIEITRVAAMIGRSLEKRIATTGSFLPPHMKASHE
jgi:hypothetical protein